MKYFDNNGAIVDGGQNNGEAYTFEDHGMIEYVSSGHIVRIYKENDRSRRSQWRYANHYSVEIDEIDNEGPVYTSQREAREVATWRIKTGRIEF